MEQNTAKTFFQSLTGVSNNAKHQTQLLDQNLQRQHQQSTGTKPKQIIKPAHTISKYSRDQMGGRKCLDVDSERDLNIEHFKLPNTPKKYKQKTTPYKLVKTQSLNNLILPDGEEDRLGATALSPTHKNKMLIPTTPETLRDTPHNTELDIWNISNTYDWDLEEDDYQAPHTSKSTIGSGTLSLETHQNYHQCILCNKWILLTHPGIGPDNDYFRHVEICDGIYIE